MEIQIERSQEFSKKMLGGANLKLKSHVRAIATARDEELIHKYGDEDLSALVSYELRSSDLTEDARNEVRGLWLKSGGSSRLSNFDKQVEVDNGRLGFITRIESAIVSTLQRQMQYRLDLDTFSGSLSFDVTEEGVQVLSQPEQEPDQ